MTPENIIFLTLIWVLVSIQASAQTTICLSYDAAGNRTQRKLCCAACLNGALPDRFADITQAHADKILIRPNPTTGIFALDASAISPSSMIVIRDMSGRLLLERRFDDGYFDVSHYPDGTYILTLMMDDIRESALLIKSAP